VHGFDGQFFPATGKTDLKRTVFDESNPLKNLNQAPFEYSYKRKEDRAEKARTADEKSKVVFHKPFLNLGLGKRQKLKWRRAWRDCILPRVLAMRPDLIFMSAGFDGHHRDTINNGFLGLEEDDYAWLTNATMRVANVCCNGRVVSMLEGGYRIQGGPASPFARSAAAHVQALCDTPSAVKWNTAEANIDTELDNNADSNLPLADNLFGDTSDLFSSPAVVPALTAKKRSRSSDPIPSDLHEVRGNGSSNGGSSSRVGQSDRVLFTEPVPAPATEVKFAASAVGGPVSVSNPRAASSLAPPLFSRPRIRSALVLIASSTSSPPRTTQVRLHLRARRLQKETFSSSWWNAAGAGTVASPRRLPKRTKNTPKTRKSKQFFRGPVLHPRKCSIRGTRLLLLLLRRSAPRVGRVRGRLQMETRVRHVTR